MASRLNPYLNFRGQARAALEFDESVFGGDVAISLSGHDTQALRGYWERLADGGKVMFLLEKRMWGDEFDRCTDRFGVAWLVNIAAG